jgi:hypothetical protein
VGCRHRWFCCLVRPGVWSLAALAKAAVPASKAATLRAIVSEWPGIRKAIAAKVAPIVCPVRRAVASIPPAAPLRSSGAAESILEKYLAKVLT